MRFIIITGLSGAGKSLTVKCMEDLGYYCVDNLPPVLIPRFAELCEKTKGTIEKIALVMDIRGGLFFDELFNSLDAFNQLGYDYEILFLDASDEVLVKRYKETRRSHPLSREGSIGEGIKLEREKLQRLKSMASTILDTSRLNPTQLKEELRHLYLEGGERQHFLISLTSFGFKYGIPMDCDLVIDVRFLPNPFYEDDLKLLTGLDQDVRNYVLENETAAAFLDKMEELLLFLMPHYIREGKHQLVTGIGCTGGKHRSVSIVIELSRRLREHGYRVISEHRDVE
ncbi:MAG: RNase adapter RapZ [Bacillota bacterium]|nr:RNase adapter RapZ [Bacillota bacterium]MDW7677532.1 RNase adapter RapZ [Bacillota bacterium]